MDQVVVESQTMEPAVHDPDAGAAAGGAAAGADGTGTTTLPPVGAGAGLAGESAGLVALGNGAEDGLEGAGAPPDEGAGAGAGAAGAGAGADAPEEADPPCAPSKPAPALVVMELSPFTTSEPGSGKSTFWFSLVVQPLPMLQVNISGSELMPP